MTFHLRAGLRFSDGSPVTATSFRRAWERVLSPKMYAQYGVFDQLNKMVVGAQRFTDGKAVHIAGIDAKGLTLSFHLTKPNPMFVSTFAIPWPGAVKPSMPYTKHYGGIAKYASAGPYYIATNRARRLVVLKRNRYYHGARPANPDRIVIRSYPNSDGEASLAQIEQNQVDYDMGGIPPADVQAVAQKYGDPANKHSQFRVGTENCVYWKAFNNSRPPTNDARIRKALNYALGRIPLLELFGPYAGTPTDQLLVPGVPGYEKFTVYGNYPDVQKAEKAGGSALESAAPLNIYLNAASPLRTKEAKLEQAEIEQIGLTANLVPADPNNYYAFSPQANIADWGLGPDRADPSEYVSAAFDNGNPWFHLRDASLVKKMNRAASLSGKARAEAYAALDRLLMTEYAPAFPFYIPNFRYLVSKRVHNIVFSHYLGGPLLNAMSVR